MDVLQIALDRTAFGSVWAPGAAFAAGFTTSFGPCVAPRFLAISSLVADAAPQARVWRVAMFCVGLGCAYVALGLGVSALVTVLRYSTALYVLLACALFAAGLRGVLGGEGKACRHAHTRGRISLTSSFGLGASFALVISPCCTPAIASLAMFAGATGSRLFAALVVGAFAAGHAVPLVAAACGAGRAAAWCERTFAVAPVNLVSGSLMLAMSGYYAVLA